jgi:NAD+ diphosphatase
MGFHGLRALFDTLPEDLFWTAGRAFQMMHWSRTHQYCGRCGHPTQDAENERAKRCPECGHTSYPRISPAIIVAVVKDDRELLLAHAKRFPKGLHSVIAGFVEPGETFEEAVRREVKEEVNIDVSDIRYFRSQPWPFPDSLMVAFTAKYAGGELQVDNVEIMDAGWYTADNLPLGPSSISVARKLIDWFVANHPTE